MAQIGAEMIFSILMLSSDYPNLLVLLNKEDTVLETLKRETQTRCTDNFGTITLFTDTILKGNYGTNRERLKR